MIMPIMGQEAVCPDGLGRVTAFAMHDFPNNYITVETYVNDRSCRWAVDNVQLVPVNLCEPRESDDISTKQIRELTALVGALHQNLDRCIERIKNDAECKQHYNDFYVHKFSRQTEDHFEYEADQFIETLALNKLK